MGRVYLARSPSGSAVAVKMVRAELAADPQFRRRFRREVAAARAVSGPWTASLIDADADAAVPWLATAYVLGPSLHDAVDAYGSLPARSLQGLGAGLAMALCVIHAAGLVHRDLKPTNVLLAADGPRVIDFGIARAADGDRVTTTGMVVGSPGYMSPEQASGQRAGPAGDVFCLASVMVFAATGRGPFDGDEPAAMLYRVVHTEPDLSGLPPALATLLRPCFAKSPDARPAPRQVADAFTPQGAAAALGDGWLPAPLAGAIARHAGMVLQMDTPQQATGPTWPAGRAQATGTSERAGVLPLLARRRLLLGSAAAAITAAAGGGAAFALAGRHGGRAVRHHGTLTGSAGRPRPSALPSGVAPDPLWRATVTNPVPDSAPTVAGDLVLVKTDDMTQGPFSATMTALDLATGKQRWAYAGILNEQAPPIVAGNFAVTLDASNDLILLDLATGEATKTVAPEGKVRFLGLLAATGTAAYVLGATGPGTSPIPYALFGYRLPTGARLWQQADGNRGINADLVLMAVRDTLITGETLNAATERTAVAARSAATGRFLWEEGVPGFVSFQASLAASAQLGLVITARLALVGWDLATGTRKWRIPSPARSAEGFGPPVFSADGMTCYAVMHGASAAVLAVDARDGDTRWHDTFNDSSFHRPVLTDGLLFVTSSIGSTGFYAVDAGTGDLRWSFQDTSSSGNEWSLAAAPQADLVVAMHDSTLLAVPAIR